MNSRLILPVALGALAVGGACGETTAPAPALPPMDSWYFYPVICNGCPGLTNVEVDRTSTPPRVKLPVGALTSLRAKPFANCIAQGPDVNVIRWIASDPKIIRLDPSYPGGSEGSQIVTALAPGVSRIAAVRLFPDGTTSIVSLSDPYRRETDCEPEPELLFEVVP
jgi:hypothetical protein